MMHDVRITIGSQSIEGYVSLRSGNDRAVAVIFEGVLEIDEHISAVGMLMLLREEDGTWVEIVTRTPVQVEYLPDPLTDLRQDLPTPSRSPEEVALIGRLSPDEDSTHALWERLFTRIRGLDDIEPAPGWEDRAMARWQRSRFTDAGYEALIAALRGLPQDQHDPMPAPLCERLNLLRDLLRALAHRSDLPIEDRSIFQSWLASDQNLLIIERLAQIVDTWQPVVR